MHPPTSLTYSDASTIIDNVMNGRDATGTSKIPTSIPLPPDMRRDATWLLMKLTRALRSAYDPADLTWLATKLLAHMAKLHASGTYTNYLEYPVAPIAEALNLERNLIGSKMGFAKLLSRHYANRPTELSALANAPVTPRRVIWTEPPYSLTEVTHPRHLIEDGRTLHHCTANRFDLDFINQLPRRPNNREAPFTLTYWQRIVDGHYRYFTFMRDDVPVFTIEYAVRAANISCIQGLAPLLTTSPLLPPLCRALHYCRTAVMPLIYIGDLPHDRDPSLFLTIDGTFEPITPGERHRVLTGLYRPPTTITFSELVLLASTPHILLHLGAAPAHLLNRITEFAGSIASHKRQVVLPTLRHVRGHFRCLSAGVIQTRSLETIGGTNYCDAARIVSQPRLSSIGRNNYCDRAHLVSQPALKTIGCGNYVHPHARIIQPSLSRNYSATRLLDSSANTSDAHHHTTKTCRES